MRPSAAGRRARSPLAGAPRRPGDRGLGDRGFSLVEVVVAVVLLGIVSTAVLGILLAAQKASVNDRNRVAAANLAARELDIVRQEFSVSADGPRALAAQSRVTNPHPLAAGAAGEPLVVDAVPYTVVRTSRWNLTDSGGSPCTGGSLVRYPTLIVSVRVTWPGMGSVRPVSNSTVLAPTKASSLSTTASFVAVSVLDSTETGRPGIPVQVSSDSETRAGVTDATGCAAVQVDPPAGGADYTVTLTAPGHVDVSGVARPSRGVGRVTPGQLVTAPPMSYDRAGSLTLQVTGPGVTAADVSGRDVSIYRSQSSGATAVSTQTLTGLTLQVSGLWPSQYGAYLGTEPPAGLPVVQVPPGGDAGLEVPFPLAQFTVTGAPPGAQVVAAPAADTAACSSTRARVVSPEAGSLPPGTWSFFARADAYGCSPGPGDIPLETGTRPALPWGTTTLQLTDAPTGMPVWAVSTTVATGSCQVPSPATHAIRLGDGTSPTVDPVPLPAGTWYVFAQPASNGTPTVGAPCSDAGLVVVPYGYPTVKPWGSPAVEVRVAGVAAGHQLIATPHTVTCLKSEDVHYYTLDATGENRTDVWGSPSPTTAADTTVTGLLPQGTWRIYEWSRSGTSGTCTLRGTVTVGNSSPLTLTGTGTGNRVGP